MTKYTQEELDLIPKHPIQKRIQRGPLRSRQDAMRIARKFEEVVREHAFRGAKHPDDLDYIEQRYQEYKERVVRHLMGVKT